MNTDNSFSNKEDKEKVLFHFVNEIFSYLNKHEQLNLRLLSKHYTNNVFPSLVNKIKLSSKQSFSNEKASIAVPLTAITHGGISSFQVNNLTLDKELLTIISQVFNNNKVDQVEMTDVSYNTYEDLTNFVKIIIEASPHITDFSICGVSNRDRLILHLDKNSLSPSINFSNLTKLSIQNLPIQQISQILSFPNPEILSELKVENSALDEELTILLPYLKTFHKLSVLSLSHNGFSSYSAKESLKILLPELTSLKDLYLKGIWFQSSQIKDLSDIIKERKTLEVIDLSYSKYLLLDTFGLSSHFQGMLTNLVNLREINLTDCRFESEDFKLLLSNLGDCNNLRSLNMTKNHLDDSACNYILVFSKKLALLEEISLSLNKHITHKGLLILLDMLSKYGEYMKLRKIDLVSSGVNLKFCYKEIANAVLNGVVKVSFDLLFTLLSDKDIVQFISYFLLESDKQYILKGYHSQINAYIKLKRDIVSKPDLYLKIKDSLLSIYSRHNYVIK